MVASEDVAQAVVEHEQAHILIAVSLVCPKQPVSFVRNRSFEGCRRYVVPNSAHPAIANHFYVQFRVGLPRSYMLPVTTSPEILNRAVFLISLSGQHLPRLLASY